MPPWRAGHPGAPATDHGIHSTGSPTLIPPSSSTSPKAATTPPVAERVLKARERFVHPLAGPRLAQDPEPALADHQHSSPRVRERHAADHQVCTSGGRIDPCLQALHYVIPPLALDQRHLAPSTLVRVADEAAAGRERRARHGVHRPAPHALDPDRLECSGHGEAPASKRGRRSDRRRLSGPGRAPGIGGCVGRWRRRHRVRPAISSGRRSANHRRRA
jgi:hypothetical protein